MPLVGDGTLDGTPRPAIPNFLRSGAATEARGPKEKGKKGTVDEIHGLSGKASAFRPADDTVRST